MKLKLISHILGVSLLVLVAGELLHAKPFNTSISTNCHSLFHSERIEGSFFAIEEYSICVATSFVTAITPAGPFCLNGPNVFLTATPPGGTWTGTGIINASTGEFSPMAAGAGSHLITYTDPVNGTAMITIVVNPAPVIAFISGDGTDCFGGSTGSTILTVTGGTQFVGPIGCKYHYDWDWDGTPGNDSYPSGCSGGIDIEDLNNIPAGSYSVTVTDAAGCTAVGVALVDEPEPIDLNAPNVALLCYQQPGVMIDLSATGGTPTFNYDWDWSGTGGNDDFGGDPSNTNDVQDPVIIGPGSYTVTVTDFLGCTAILIVSVTQPPELDANATSIPVLCTGNNTGSITLTVTGGTPGFLFDWDYDGVGDNNDPQNPTNLLAGTYQVIVTDANGCTATASVVVTQPTLAVTASVTSTNISCNGDANGSINLTPGGGTGAYTYDWDNDGVGDFNDPQDLNNLPPGSYSVTVMDANGCTAVASTTITQPPPITGTFTDMICAGGSVTVNGTVYDQSNSSGTEVFTAANGCDSTVTVTITFDPPLTGTFTYAGCQGDGYSVVINGTTYSESNPSGMETVTTSQGCDSIITVSLQFSGTVFGQFSYEGCSGDGYQVVIGGNTYNESNPSGTSTITSVNGCDSIVTVSLVFNTDTYAAISNQGCQGDNFSITINGTVYNQNNPSGTETITNQAGCDSIVTISLFFGAPSSSQVTNTSCSGSGYSVVVNGTTYNESNSSGTEVLTNSVGCDSTITINLTFIPPSTGNFNYTGCQGNGYSITINGTVYNESNPSGTETFTGSNGCDSIVTIQLTFSGALSGSESYTGCTGDGYEVVVGSTTFDEANPTGMETLTSASGCDSIVTVTLSFLQPTEFDLNYQGCVGDGYSTIINGVLYNQNNPSGVEIITNQAGCDSIITIDLVFMDPSSSSIIYTGCHNNGYFVVVNGTTYDEANPQGTEILTNAVGCDSVVTIDLTFLPTTTYLLTYIGCIGDGYSVIVNGNTYDESQPSGVEVLVNSNGCDSVVTIDLSFSSQIVTVVNPTLCEGGFIVVNGNTYDQNNPVGSELFTAVGGCDSVVMIELEFFPPLTGTFTADLCEGGSIVVNGTVYDENNPSGTEIFITAAGCDSTVQVEINFLTVLTGLVTYQGCIGDGYFVFVNGTLYNENNPSGTELMPTAQGCDSLITINLSFQNGYSSNIDYNGCSGDGYFIAVNNVTYNESNPVGEEHLTNQAGCDSTIFINLVYHPKDTVLISNLACTGDNYSITVNGNVYNEQNPNGTELLTNSFGCDSVVIINLSYLSQIENYVTPGLCNGDTLVIGGNVYTAANPIDTLSYVAVGGCDSIVYIALQILPNPDSVLVNYIGCFGDGYSFNVNGQTYNESNPTGIEILQAFNGCDSLVIINLSFQSCCVSDTVSISQWICVGGVYDFYGDQLTTTGQYAHIIPNANGPGCDSLFELQLYVTDAVFGPVTADICQGESFFFGGQNYSQPGVYSDTIPGGAALGCDSIAQLTLNVHPNPVADAGADQMITCSSLVVTLQGSAQGGILSWSGPAINGSNYLLPDPMVNKPGDYVLSVESQEGCASIDSVQVNADQNTPIADAGPDLSISCKSNLAQLQAVLLGQNLEWYWEGPGIQSGNAMELNPIVDTSGMYILHLRDTLNMCTAIPDTVMVMDMINIITAYVYAPDTISCEIRLITLDGTASSNGSSIIYTWLDSLGLFLSNSPIFQVTNPGMFMFLVQDTISGCEDSTSVMVMDQGDYPHLVAGEDKLLNCQIKTAVLDATIGPPVSQLSILWTGPAGGFIGDPSGVPVEVSLPGWYFITVMDTVNDCTSKDSIYVADQTTTPEANAVVDNQIDCHEIEASVHSEHPGFAYDDIWLDDQGNVLDSVAIIKIQIPGKYYLEVNDPVNGCTGLDSIFISAIPPPIASLAVSNEICKGDLQGSIIISGIVGGVSPYLYTLNGNNTQTIPVFENLGPGVYHVEVMDSLGCIWEQEAFVEEGIEVTIEIGPDLSLQPGDTYQLQAVTNIPFIQIDSFLWQPGTMLSCTNCPNPLLTAITPAEISAIVFEQGCSDTAYTTLRIDREYEVYIPNTFSPNYDGVNDNFTIYSDASVKRVVQLQIFDRWGNKIFEASDFKTNDPSKGWDGTFKQKLLNPGVFVYTAVLEYPDGSTGNYSGDITLVR